MPSSTFLPAPRLARCRSFSLPRPYAIESGRVSGGGSPTSQERIRLQISRFDLRMTGGPPLQQVQRQLLRGNGILASLLRMISEWPGGLNFAITCLSTMRELSPQMEKPPTIGRRLNLGPVHQIALQLSFRYKTLFFCPNHGFGTVSNSDLSIDSRQVRSYSPYIDGQLFPDLIVAETLRKQGKDLQLYF